MEPGEVAHDAERIRLPDGEAVLDVAHVHHHVVVHHENRLGAKLLNRVELVVQGIGCLPGKKCNYNLEPTLEAIGTANKF